MLKVQKIENADSNSVLDQSLQVGGQVPETNNEVGAPPLPEALAAFERQTSKLISSDKKSQENAITQPDEHFRVDPAEEHINSSEEPEIKQDQRCAIIVVS